MTMQFYTLLRDLKNKGFEISRPQTGMARIVGDEEALKVVFDDLKKVYEAYAIRKTTDGIAYFTIYDRNLPASHPENIINPTCIL